MNAPIPTPIASALAGAETPPTPKPAPPPSSAKPAYRTFDEDIRNEGRTYRAGLWHFPAEGSPMWVCAPLHIVAATFDQHEANFGRLIRYRNSRGNWRELSIPMAMLGGDGAEVRTLLLSAGLMVDPNGRAKNKLTEFLVASLPAREVHCALQVGWHGNSFVLPDEVIGGDAGQLVFQSPDLSRAEFVPAGTLEGWQQEVAALAPGNPMLIVALCAAFAAPLLERCGMESCGVHLFGDSSTGKTTIIDAGRSVWGGKALRRSWRATTNGMEAAAAMSNDSVLVADEIGEADPRQIGGMIYGIGNGRGRQRMTRAGTARQTTTWRCVMLSSGEITAATAIEAGGTKAKAGQQVRLVDLPAARAHGVWDDLRDFESGTALSDHVRAATATHYGHPIRAYLKALCVDGEDLRGLLDQMRAQPQFSVRGAHGQVNRVGEVFALFAVAGEKATDYGVTGWKGGDAVQGCATMFAEWVATRGKGNSEAAQVLGGVLGFIQKHGSSRFSNPKEEPPKDRAAGKIVNRAGYWRDPGYGRREYLFNKEGMREAIPGAEPDFRRGLDQYVVPRIP